MFAGLADRDRSAARRRRVGVIDETCVGFAVASVGGSAEILLVPKFPKAKYLLQALGADQQLAALALQGGINV